MTKKRLVLLLICVLILPATLYSKPSPVYTLGKLQLSPLKLVYNDITINTYSAYDTNYIAVSDLRKLGCIITPSHKDLNISAPLKNSISTSSALSISPNSYSFYSGTVQFGNLETQALYSNNSVFIPLATLYQFGTLAIDNNICTFTPGTQVPVVATETALKNFSNEALKISLVDIYWNKKAYFKEYDYTVAAGEIIKRTPNTANKDTIHIATIVKKATGTSINYQASTYLGQLNTPLLEQYTRKVNESRVVRDYGDPINLSDVNTIENIINSKNLSSPTKYLVWTKIDNQHTYIFEGSKNNWKLIKCFICSTGRDSTPTPTGTFALTYKVPSFGQNKGYCCKYAFGFIGTNYLYHSIIFDRTGTYLLEGKGVLGKKASQGCIRFSAENAKWFYDHLISGSTVYIS